jgi:hypothetical protein
VRFPVLAVRHFGKTLEKTSASSFLAKCHTRIIRSYLSMNFSPRQSTKERARIAPVKHDKPLKLAQLRAAKRIWLNAAGQSVRNTAKIVGKGLSTVQRVKVALER